VIGTFTTPEGYQRAFGRDTETTQRHWDAIVAQVDILPQMFAGNSRKSPNIRRFHHATPLSQRSRGYCVPFNWTATIMTRLRIPAGATSTTGTPLPVNKLSPLYTCDVSRNQARADGVRLVGDGQIGSICAKATHLNGVVPIDVQPSGPSDIDRHSNSAQVDPKAKAVGALHLVREFGIAQSFRQGLDFLAAGFPVAFASAIPQGMMKTSATGEFAMKGMTVGGHEYQILDFDEDLDRIWVGQAWEYWGEKTSDPEFAPMNGFTQVGYCRLSDMENWFSDRAMASGSSEIMVANTVEGFSPPIVDYSGL
jgi:hypothetical protein